MDSVPGPAIVEEMPKNLFRKNNKMINSGTIGFSGTGLQHDSFSGYCKVGRNVRKPVSGFPTRSETSQAALPHKMARGLKFRI